MSSGSRADSTISNPVSPTRHPNYVAVVVEGVALPLVHSCWVTAVAFTVLNAVLLARFRIPAEERALALATAGGPRPASS